ncbi:unnamed protein product [Choristocarpus tenellus]
MGGGRHFHYPKYVWSPSGGWWNNPANWRQNTVVAFLCIGVTCAGIFKISTDKERRPIAPHFPIPSQRWCKHAKEDDPSLE